jgi:hypothetical protein
VRRSMRTLVPRCRVVCAHTRNWRRRATPCRGYAAGGLSWLSADGLGGSLNVRRTSRQGNRRDNAAVVVVPRRQAVGTCREMAPFTIQCYVASRG